MPYTISAAVELMSCLSDVLMPRRMIDGTPKREIQPLRNACAMASVVIELSGIASGQRVKRSTHVRRYVKPWDGGRGPTMSI